MPTFSGDGPLPEVLDYYERFPEESRLQQGAFRLEFERTKELLERLLPSSPATVVDVGGAAGAYSFWMASRGYEVHLVDGSDRLVAEARARNTALDTPVASITAADARSLPQRDGSADAVLVMGPLYHLPHEDDRVKALHEALRVVREGGTVIVAAISRYASALDGLTRQAVLDPAFRNICNEDLSSGQHRNDTDNLAWFTTAFFHRPEDLERELTASGLMDVTVFGVEGPGWMLADFDARWQDAPAREHILDLARRVETERSIVGVSAHLLGAGRRGEGSL